MKKKHLKLIIDFLEEHSEALGNNGCNDWNFPKDWTQKDIAGFLKVFSHANCPSNPKGDGEDYSDNLNGRYLVDFCAVATLVYLLKKELKKK